MKRITLATLLLLSLAATAEAVDTAITVATPAGPALGNATIQITSASGEVVAEEKTDEDGIVVFDLPEGNYTATTVDGAHSVEVRAGEAASLTVPLLYGILDNVAALTDYFYDFDGSLAEYTDGWNLMDEDVAREVEGRLGARLDMDWQQLESELERTADAADRSRQALMGTADQAELAALFSKIFEDDDGTTLAEKTAEFGRLVQDDPAELAARQALIRENTAAVISDMLRDERLAALDAESERMRTRNAIARELSDFRAQARADGVWTPEEEARDDEISARWMEAWQLTPEEEARIAAQDAVRDEVLNELQAAARALGGISAEDRRRRQLGQKVVQDIIDWQKIDDVPLLGDVHATVTGETAEELGKDIFERREDYLESQNLIWAAELYLQRTDITPEQRRAARQIHTAAGLAKFAAEDGIAMDAAVILFAVSVDGALLLAGEPAAGIAGKIGPGIRAGWKALWVRLFGEGIEAGAREGAEAAAREGAGAGARNAAGRQGADETARELGQSYFDDVANRGAQKARELGIPEAEIAGDVRRATNPAPPVTKINAASKWFSVQRLEVLAQWDDIVARALKAGVRQPVIDDIIARAAEQGTIDAFVETARNELALAILSQEGGQVIVSEVRLAAGGRKLITDTGLEAWEDFMGALAKDHPAQSIDTQILQELIDAFKANGSFPADLSQAQRRVLSLVADLGEAGAETLWLFDDLEAALVRMADEGFVQGARDWAEAALAETATDIPAVRPPAPPSAALPGGTALSEAGTVLDSPAGSSTIPPPGFRDAPTAVDAPAGGTTAPPPSIAENPTVIDTPAGGTTAPPPSIAENPTVIDAPAGGTAATPPGPVPNPPATGSGGNLVPAGTAATATAVSTALADAEEARETADALDGIRDDVDALTDFFEGFEGTAQEYNDAFLSLDDDIADQVQARLDAREAGDTGAPSAETDVSRPIVLNPRPSGVWRFTGGRWHLVDTVDAAGGAGLEPVIARVPPGSDGGSLSASYFAGGLVLGSERFLFGVVPSDLLDTTPPDDLVFEPDSPRVKKFRDHYLRSRGAWGQDFDDQWAIKRVGFTWDRDSAWRVPGAFDHEVVVAVIDSGVNWHHPDLTDAPLWRNEDEIPGNGIDDDGNGYVDDIIGWNFVSQTNIPWDRDGHGTFVAGLIAARSDNRRGIAGINPSARIMVLKAMDDEGRTRASFLTQAIVYAADNGARVINLSVGGLGLSRAEQAAVNYAWEKGAVVVAAAGNEGEEVSGYSPAGLDHVLTVASTGHDDRRAPSSNWGSGIDIAAPGVDVLSLRAPGTDLAASVAGPDYAPGSAIVGPDRAYYHASGTSFSVAIVTGVASLVLSHDPSLTNEQVERVLLQSARDTEEPGFDRYTGYGIVDARAALTADPAFFTEAAISGVRVVQKDGRQLVEVSGTASADRFQRAWVEVGRGDDPSEWVVASDELAASVEDGPVAEIDVKHFQGARRFTLRLVVEHANGRRREARFTLDLG